MAEPAAGDDAAGAGASEDDPGGGGGDGPGCPDGTPGPERAERPRPGAGARPPPLRLPAEHFAAALIFFVLGGAGLVWVAPALAAGAFADLRVAAVTHLFTLGWITMVILGVLYQFLPVHVGAPFRSETLAHATFFGLAAGVLALAGGLALGRADVFVPGAVLTGAALVAYVGHLAVTLPRAEERGLTWWTVAGGGFFLLATIALGVLLTLNLRSGILGSRFLVVGLHLHIAAAGWILLVIIGVAHELMPTFLRSSGVTDLPARAAAGLVAAGSAVLSLVHHAVGVEMMVPAGGAIALGTACFLLQAGLHHRASRTPGLGPPMGMATVGLGLLALALVAGPPAMARGPAAPRLAVAYVVLLVPGAFSLFVAGHACKIAPTLVWSRRFGPVAAERDVPGPAELVEPGPIRLATALLALGVLGLGAAVLAGSGTAARASALLYAIGAAMVAWQLIGVLLRRPSNAPRASPPTSGAG